VSAAASERELPKSLGTFAIAGVLGEGGSGVVYDATWGHRRVALKVLREELLGTPRERDRFLAEAELLQAVEHPGVVKVLGTGTLPDGRPYLAMEHLDGETLARRVERAPLDTAEALALFTQLADAVAALHARGLVHRDIKPENIFVVSGHAVLLDFGIAKPEAAAPSTTTQEGSVRGTPAYMAPERFFGAPASTATDVYELAVVLYVMIAGRLPWTDVVDPAARLNPPRLSELGHAVSTALETALAMALSTRAEARPASVRDLAERVRGTAVVSDLALRVTEPLRPKPPVSTLAASSPASPARTETVRVSALADTVQALPRSANAAPTVSRRRRRAVVAIGAGLVLAGAAVVFTVVRERGEPAASRVPARPADPTTPRLDPDHDPWAAHAAAPATTGTSARPVAPSTPATTELPATPEPAVELAARPIAVPPALAAQLDLHPADADLAMVMSGAKLRASAAMTMASKTSVELAQLSSACGFDLLRNVDQVVLTGKVDGFELALDVSVRGKLAADAADRCVAVLFGGAHPSTTSDHGATRIAGGSRTLWVSHPDASTVYVTTRGTDHIGHRRDPSVRRAPVAKLVSLVDAGAALWLVGSPRGAAGELFPGVAPPRAMYASVVLTSAIDVRGGFRFADAATATAASRALRAKLGELETDPVARGVLGNSTVGVVGADATFAIPISETFASITLQSLLKYVAP
jgi:serine/threonine-protein kinase